MAETTADVRRDIELTRERMSSTIDQLEQKLNVVQMVRDHPWPALAIAVGAGVLLSSSKADVKAAAAAAAATKGASSKIADVLDDVVAGVMTAATDALRGQMDHVVDEIKHMIGARSNGTWKGYGVGPVDLLPEKGPRPVHDVPRAD
jgi:ElaB/YqjD/DUF883 family membrane-anchored ribosome-binding protein